MCIMNGYIRDLNCELLMHGMNAYHTEVLPGHTVEPVEVNHTVGGAVAGTAAHTLELEVDRRWKELAVHTGAAVHIVDKTF